MENGVVLSERRPGALQKATIFCALLFAASHLTLAQAIVANSGFESGTASWTFYTNGAGSWRIDSLPPNPNHFARISITRAGSNVQFYQSSIRLEAGKRYRLTLRAYCSTGHDVAIYLHKHTTPFTTYGIDGAVLDLGTGWNSYAVDFTATSTATDGRLRFWLTSGVKDDRFYFDDVTITAVNGSPPTITRHPVSLVLAEGNAATFRVAPSGTAPLTYRWQKNGEDIAGAANDTYTIAAAMQDSGKQFRCIVTNAFGSAASDAAQLRVLRPPTIIAGPADTTVLIGGTGRFSIVATGSAISYQWQRGEVPIPGATSATLALFPVTAADDSALFRCEVRNAVGSLFSRSAFMRVLSPARIVVEPQPQTVAEGAQARFSVSTQGTSPLQWQWFKNGTLLSGAIDSLLNLPAVTSADSGARFWCIVQNNAGIDTSTTALLHVLTPPRITRQPVGVTVGEGDSARFVVQASGTLPVSLQWFRNGTPITWAQDTVFIINAVMPADSGTIIFCRASNAAGQVNSDTVQLTVLRRVRILVQPLSCTVAIGMPVSLSIAAIGAPPLAYQWTKDGVPITGAQSATLFIPSSSSADSGAAFRCVVSNGVSAETSTVAILHVLQPPRITLQPRDTTVVDGASAQFVTRATGSGALAYRWQVNGTHIAGATDTLFVLSSVTTSDSGTSVRCISSNAVGSDTSRVATLHVLSLRPSITYHPSATTVEEGDAAAFAVIAHGSRPLHYQWLRNESPIPSASESVYVIPSAMLADSGSVIRCVVFNRAGTDTSVSAQLSVLARPPHITIQPTNTIAFEGDSARFVASATGTMPWSYRWLRNGVEIPGSSLAVYTLPSVTIADDSAAFRCIISNRAGADTSSIARLYVRKRRPRLIAQPVNVSAAEGDTVRFAISASGTPPLAFQWLRNTTPIPGGRDSLLTFGPVQFSNNSDYFRCVVTNDAGSDTSLVATLSVSGIPPIVVSQPADTVVADGDTVCFKVRATGSLPLSFQWQKNGIALASQLDSILVLATIGLADSGNAYRCVISNVAGTVTSRAAVLSVLGRPPIITQSPSGLTVQDGDSVSFEVVISGSAPLSFQWQRNGADIVGAGQWRYILSRVVLTDSGAALRCIAFNRFGRDTSTAAILRVLPLPPIISIQPTNQSHVAGDTAVFMIAANGSPPLQYEWLKDSARVSTSAGPLLRYGPVSVADSGVSFRCVVANSAGTVTSSRAILSVEPGIPVILTHPVDVSVSDGESASFAITASSVLPMQYQWQRNGVAIPGASAAILAFSTASPQDSGNTYRCVVSNAAGSVTSRSALLSVRRVAPTLLSQPVSQFVIERKPATFSLVAAGSLPLTFQWRKNGAAITGATSSVLTLSSPHPADSGATFDCIVSNAAGSIISQQALLHVIAQSRVEAKVLCAINAGGPAFTSAADSVRYSADAYVTGGSTFNAGAIGIAGTDDDVLYQTERWGGFSYNIPLPPRRYRVTLRFAEIYWTASGKRIFNVNIENTRVLSSFDIFARIGKNVAFDTTFIVQLTDTLLTISFSSILDNSKLSALVVRTEPEAVPPTITAHPSQVIAALGDTAMWTIAATGSTPMLYQWQKNRMTIPGATFETLTHPGVTRTDSGALYRCIVNNPFGQATSNEAMLLVQSTPARIVTAPLSQSVSDGQPVTLTCVAEGTPPLDFLWTKNGQLISGARGSSYATIVTFTDSGTVFRCIARNRFGSDTSAAAVISVRQSPPVIAGHPENRIVYAGDVASFVVAATGTQPLRYQWRTGEVEIPGATSATYVTSVTTPSENGSRFTCVVSNSAGSATSNAALLTVLIPPTPGSVIIHAVNCGGPTFFSAADSITYHADTLFSGGNTYTANAVPINGTQDDNLFHSERWGGFRYLFPVAPGKYQVILRFAEVYWTQAGQRVFNVQVMGNPFLTNFDILRVTQRNAAFDTSLTITLTSQTLEIQFTSVVDMSKISAIVVKRIPTATPPLVLTNPQDCTVSENDSASFRVSASGSEPLQYQWQRQGINLSGATSTVYAIPNVTVVDSGATFRCVISNSAGTATSGSAMLRVVSAPASIVAHPESLVVEEGQQISFSVNTSGSQPLSYQWQRNGTSIASAMSSTYSLVSQPADSGALFRCIATNRTGSAISRAALLRVGTIPPTILVQPRGNTVYDGDSVTLEVKALGAIPLMYQWTRDGVTIPGAFASRFTSGALTIADSGATFRCVVSNKFGFAVSDSARIIIRARAPSITLHPANQSSHVGGRGTFTVGASGSQPLVYQWLRNDSVIVGATLSTYTTPPGSASDNGTLFRCIVSNIGGRATSNAATWTVGGSAPIITTHPAPLRVASGQRMRFTVAATGAAPLLFQ